MKFGHQLFIVLFLIVSITLSCSKNTSEVQEIYIAEKMYYKANKFYQNILVNPAVAREEDYNHAVAKFEEIVNRYKGRKELSDTVRSIYESSLLMIPQIHIARKNFQKAIEAYEGIIKENAQNQRLCATAQMSIAQCFERDNKLEEAIAAYKKLINDYPAVLDDPESPNVQILQVPLHLARLYSRQQGDSHIVVAAYDEAISYYGKLVSRWPKTKTAFVAYNQMVAAYSDQRMWSKAVKIMRKALHDFPNHENAPDILMNMANIYVNFMNNYTKGWEIYKRILEDYPDYERMGTVYLGRGNLYLKEKQTSSAREEFQRVLKDYSKEGEACALAQIGIARSYEMEGNWEKALNEYQWAVDNFSMVPQVLQIPLYIASYYKNKKQENLARAAYEKGIGEYQNVVRQYPNSMLASMAQDHLARCYIELQRWEEAVKALETLVQMPTPVPIVAPAYLSIGSIYEKNLNDKLQAVKAYREFLERFPDTPLTQRVEERIELLQAEIDSAASQPPQPVQLLQAESISPSSLLLKWIPNHDDDFAYYRIFRSVSPHVDVNSTLVAEIKDQQQANYQDSSLKSDSLYYYRVFVYDYTGLSSGSNEITGKPVSNLPPKAVTLKAKCESWVKISLDWDASEDQDFQYYKIYRSQSSGVNLSSQLIKFISDRSLTYFEDTPPTDNAEFYYKVYVFDTGGLYSESNEVRVKTPANTPPHPVRLREPQVMNNNTLRLSWTPSNDDDFAMYRIYRSEDSPVVITKEPLKIISDRYTTQYYDSGLEPNKRYYYKIFVFDKGNLSTESNEVAGIPVGSN